KYSPDANMSSMANIPGGAPVGVSPVVVDASLPKGKALADWMQYTKATMTYGQVTPDVVFNNFSFADSSKVQTYGSSGAPLHPRFMTVNTPVGQPAAQQCGKAVHLDAHINQTDRIDGTFPAGCSSPIKSGEAAFAFFFFDLSACIQDETKPP